MSEGISKDQLSCSLIVVEGHLEPSQDASLILNQSRDAGSTPLQLAREREHIACDWQSGLLTARTPSHVFDDGTCQSVSGRAIEDVTDRSAQEARQNFRCLAQSIAQ
jgi:hypothetical protein